ncbi:MAG: ATP-binding protein [Bacteroidota bacterium]
MRTRLSLLYCLFFILPLAGKTSILDSLQQAVATGSIEERIRWKNRVETAFLDLEFPTARQAFAQEYLNQSLAAGDSIFIGSGYFLLAQTYEVHDGPEAKEAWQNYQSWQSQYGWHLNDLPFGKKYWYYELQVLEDSDQVFEFKDIRKRPQAFLLNDSHKTYQPTDVYWVKLVLRGHPDRDNNYLFHIANDHVGRLSWLKINAWLEHQNGQIDSAQSGFLLPKTEKEVPVSQNMVRLPVRASERAVLYLRLEGTKRFIRPDRIQLGLVSENWWAEKNSESWRRGSLLAVLIIQFLYFLILFFIEREHIHLFFAIALLGLALDYGCRYIGAFSTSLGPWDVIGYNGIPLFLIGITHYTAYYFKLTADTWLAKRGLGLFTILSAVYIAIAWITHFSFSASAIPSTLLAFLVTAIVLITIAGIVICLYLAFGIGKIYPHYQKFYLLSFAPLLIILLLFIGLVVTSSQGLALQSSSYISFFTYGQEISLFLMLVLLALSTGYRARRQREEQQAALQQEQIYQQKARLYTNITHEFRTPLTVIMGMAEEIKRKPREAQEMIKRNANNLLQLVNQILDLSKLESGNLQLKLQQQDVVQLLLYISESFQSLADTKQVKLTTYNEIDELWMDIDPDKLQQIVSNLLSNAIKFTSVHGKVIMHINQVQSNTGGSQLRLKVKDNGIGIAADELELIFDRFYQVNSPNKVPEHAGTGIGLALCKELVELMNGTISVKSELGQGTTFEVLIPVQRTTARASTTNIPQAKETTVVQEPLLKGVAEEQPLLLIVEDNPDVVSYIKTCLEDHYRILTAVNGQLGIDTATAEIPDIIISDVMMPEKNGYEVCAALKTDQRTSHIPIVLLTAKHTDEDKIQGLQQGADAYLTKPFNKAELLVRLKQLVALRQTLRSRYGEVELARVRDNAPNNPNDAFLLQLHELLAANLSDADFGIPQICKGLGLSRSQLYRKLTALTSKSSSHYIRSIRLHKAKKLLETTKLNVSEVAYDVGFSDPLYFSRVFSQEFGFPPSQA